MELVGKSFKVLNTRGFETVISILGIDKDEFIILMTSSSQWGTRESTEHLSKDLFDTCLRTGYLAPCA